jgi:hypothetical protein
MTGSEKAEDRKTIKTLNTCNLNRLVLNVLFIVFTFNVIGQNVKDSLISDTSNNIRKIATEKKDTIRKYVALNKMFSKVDSSSVQTGKKDPRRATILSAILPGLGQAYNEKYWKIPVVYSIFAFMLFVTEDNNDKYHKFKQAYLTYGTDEQPDWLPSYMSKDMVKIRKDAFRRDRDLCLIITAGVYLLNILDANVDAHLMDYDISDDLSLRIKPDYHSLYSVQNLKKNSSFGLKFVLSF